MVDVDSIKRLKKKSKGRRPKSDLTPVVMLIIIVAIGAVLSLTIPKIFESMKEEKQLYMQTFEKTKEDAISQVESIFAKYPSDPKKSEFITKIRTAQSEEEIDKIIEEAYKYVTLKDYKENLKNQIKSIYGENFAESPFAQKIAAEIDLAETAEEAGNIFKENAEKLNEDAKKYYIDKFKIYGKAKYVRVFIDNQEYLMSGKEFLKELESYDLVTLKKLKVYKITMCEVPLIVPARACGELPKPGDKIIVYDTINISDIVELDVSKLPTDLGVWKVKKNINNTPKKSTLSIPITEAIVKEAYILTPSNMSYSESKSSSITISQDADTSSASKDVKVEYNLQGLNNILHAAVMGKVDYNKVASVLEKYGYRLNKLEKETQLFNGDDTYLLIIEVPSDKVSMVVSSTTPSIVKINK